MAGAPPAASRRERLVTAMLAIRDVEMALYRRLHEGLVDIPGVRLFGITDPDAFEHRTPTAAFTLGGLTAGEVAERLGDEGIAVWDGNFYALGLVERLGLEGTGGLVRLGLTHYNTADEVDRALEAVGEIAATAGTRSVAGSAAAGH